MIIAEAKWRHWKPGRLKEESATTQRKLEFHLRERWAERVIGILLPYAKDIPHMRAVQGNKVQQEYLDLLGGTRFHTLRIHCLCFENIQKLGFNVIPWKESDIRNLLNTMRDQEITPHKLQSIWNTLRWFAAKFGLMDPDSLERLKAKRKIIQEGLVETNIKPQRKAKLPSKEVIVVLEKIAAGEGAANTKADGASAKLLLDRYICAMTRFQVACSASFNDLQHTSPMGYKLTETTLELQAWQTKTVSNQKEASPTDRPALLIHGPGLVVHRHPGMGQIDSPGQVPGYGLSHSNYQFGLHGLDSTPGPGGQDAPLAQRCTTPTGCPGKLNIPTT